MNTIKPKMRIHQSIKNSQQQFLLSFEKFIEANNPLPFTTKLPDTEMYIIDTPLDVKPSRRRRSKSKTDAVCVGDKNRGYKESKKKKRTKKPRDRSEEQQQEQQQALAIPEYEGCVYVIEEKYQPLSPCDSFSSSFTISFNEECCYLSDITDDDEIIRRKTRKSKTTKDKRKKRRPKSERDNIGESFRTQQCTKSMNCLDQTDRTNKSTNYLDQTDRTNKSTTCLEISTELRRWRPSAGDTKPSRGSKQRTNSFLEDTTRSNRTKSTRTKSTGTKSTIKTELSSVISDEIPVKQPSSRRMLKSEERPLRRPRSSFEKKLIAERKTSTRRRSGRRPESSRCIVTSDESSHSDRECERTKE